MNRNVVATVHTPDGGRAVKIIKQDDGAFRFEGYRRDPEDAGGWTLVTHNSRGPFRTKEEALAAAEAAWLQPKTSSAEGAR